MKTDPTATASTVPQTEVNIEAGEKFNLAADICELCRVKLIGEEIDVRGMSRFRPICSFKRLGHLS